MSSNKDTYVMDHNAQRPTATLNGRHVLLAMIGFFGVIFAVNGIFLYKAIGSYSGIVADEPYRKGLNYNDRILADAVQHTLGWTHKLSVKHDGHVQVSVVDRTGTPIEQLEVEVALGRPATVKGELKRALKPTGPGTYEARFAGLPAGNLISSIEIKHLQRDGTMITAYRAKERVWLKP